MYVYMCICTYTYVRIYMYLCAMQHAATHWNARKHTTATHCNAPQHTYLCVMRAKNHNPTESIFICKSQIQSTSATPSTQQVWKSATHSFSLHMLILQRASHFTSPQRTTLAARAQQCNTILLLPNTHTATHCALTARHSTLKCFTTARHSTLKCFTAQHTRYLQVCESVTHAFSLPNADTLCTSVHSSASHSLHSAAHSSSLHMPTLQHTPH